MPSFKEKLIARLIQPGFLAVLAFLLTLPFLFLLKIPRNDVASRYAPMAEAFSNEQWLMAFHPRIPPLHPVVAGILETVFHTDGFTATKLASALFFALGLLPFHGILRRVFDKKTAVIGSLLYLFCAPWLELAFSGLRDSAKGASLLLAVYGVVLVFQRLDKWKGFVFTAIGSAGLALVRGDCLLYALLLLATAAFADLRRNGRFHFPLRALAGTLLFAVLISPWVYYQYRTIGYPVTAVQQARIIIKLKARLGGSVDKLSSRPVAGNPDQTSFINPSTDHLNIDSVAMRLTAKPKEFPVSEFAGSVFKGFYPPFALIALPVIFLRIRRKLWTGPETFLLAAVLLHAGFQIVQIALADGILFMSSRYLISAAPLLFGWTAIGLIWIYHAVPQSLRCRKWIRLVPAVLLIALYLHAGQRIIKSFTSERSRTLQKSIFACAEWIRTTYPNCGQYDPKTPMDPSNYRTGKRPRILTDEPSIGFFVGGEAVDLQRNKSNLRRFLKELGIEFIVINRHEAEMRGLDQALGAFTTGNGKHGMIVFDLRSPQNDRIPQAGKTH